MRPITGIIMILLPLAKHLGATSILSVIMALFVICTFWETIASLRKGALFWERWEETQYPEKNLITDEAAKKEVGSEP
jgi:hypothetical protein